MTEQSTFAIRQRSIDGGRPEGQLTLDGDVVRDERGDS